MENDAVTGTVRTDLPTVEIIEVQVDGFIENEIEMSKVLDSKLSNLKKAYNVEIENKVFKTTSLGIKAMLAQHNAGTATWFANEKGERAKLGDKAFFVQPAMVGKKAGKIISA